MFELTGIASFNLSEKEIKKWFYDFGEVYQVSILHPKLFGSAEVWFDRFAESLFGYVQKKATFGDAIILKEAEDHQMDGIVTWNRKDFDGRFINQVFTPEEFLVSHGK